MRLSILIPFRDADGTRIAAKEWIVARWRHYWPDAEIIEGTDDGIDPFNKSMAVNDAASRAVGDTLIILDADTWVDPEGLELCLQKVEGGLAAWGRPRHAFRLKREFSERLMRIRPDQPLPTILGSYAETSTPAVGFLWMVPRAGFEKLGGMDERIRGWGGEDSAFTIAADKVIGHHRSFSGMPVVSLWHPRPRDLRQQRVWPGQDRLAEGYKIELLRQYRMASGPQGMLRVLAEAGGPFREAVA